MQKRRDQRLWLALASARFAAGCCPPMPLLVPVRCVFSGLHSTRATAVTNQEEILAGPRPRPHQEDFATTRFSAPPPATPISWGTAPLRSPLIRSTPILP